MEESNGENKYGADFEHWSDEQIKKFVDNSIKSMSTEDIENEGKKIKRQKITGFAVTGVLSILFLTMSIVFLVTKISNSWLILLVGAGVLFVYSLLCFKPQTFNWNYEQLVFKSKFDEAKKLQKKICKTKQELDDLSQINGKKIVSVAILDCYTEVTNKLHAFLNYNEIIQHRMYKFLVKFEDGSSKIYAAEENDKIYNKLIRNIDKENNVINSSKTEELLNYKKLLDAGAITEEEYEKQKNILLK